MNKIRNMNDTDSENLKFIVLHINDTQVKLLEKFFEKIGIYYYTVEDNVKRAIDKSIKHQQTKIWPGSDALVTFPLGEKKVDEFLVKLKTFRMVLPKGLILSVGIIPFERVIRSIYEEDIPIDEELMEELQNDKDYNI
ncbi:MULTISPECIES: hypothetical protein [Fusobacterium]|jgi:hypothetical protein|uniref:Uncharacterized protein n=1 Tax=Fusobacterium hwasookii ChDC F174 TaxID=1307442 RepID=A0A0S2ZPI4_9FUSO|nr:MULTISPECIES: hypothetical protein [Fusobacterium]ALQ40792.1 hypothetical protein RN87_09700 [Fusobacterium hwasookii ChDC F174]QYR55341.1 hypothetical protein JY400_01800 [Fusobacterium hwasookii]QYR58817.1 hypothetical protein JY397_10770 [Fusobacterium polymorphum]